MIVRHHILGKLGLALCTAAILSTAGCGLLSRLFGTPFFDFATGAGPLAPAGAVSLHITNKSGYPAAVEASYKIDTEEVRLTTRFLQPEGIESETDVLATVTSVLKIVARVAEKDPTSQPATSQPATSQPSTTQPTSQPTSMPVAKPGDLLLDLELKWKVDFAAGAHLLIEIPGPQPPPADFIDCNHNGISDTLDIAAGSSRDCNCNSIPDECDLLQGVLHDTSPADGIPDECTSCPSVQLVVIMDTSGSMDDEAAALCSFIMSVVIDDLTGRGITVNETLLGITETPEGPYACLKDTVANLLGTAVPGSPACCPSLSSSEDWGNAVAIVADRFAWTPGAVKVLIPISDEGPRDGDPCNNPGDDLQSIQNAVQFAHAKGVMVSPITGTGADQCVIELAGLLASGTGGMALATSAPDQDLAASIRTQVLDACSLMNHCGS